MAMIAFWGPRQRRPWYVRITLDSGCGRCGATNWRFGPFSDQRSAASPAAARTPVSLTTSAAMGFRDAGRVPHHPGAFGQSAKEQSTRHILNVIGRSHVLRGATGACAALPTSGRRCEDDSCRTRNSVGWLRVSGASRGAYERGAERRGFRGRRRRLNSSNNPSQMIQNPRSGAISRPSGDR
jgi:hypothetical protein